MSDHIKIIKLTIPSPEAAEAYGDDLFLEQFFGDVIRYPLQGWEIEPGPVAKLFQGASEIELSLIEANQNFIKIRNQRKHHVDNDVFFEDLKRMSYR